jgi:hypothetical protein
MIEKTWDELTDAEQDELNQASWDACADLLRRADEKFPGCELSELKRYVGECLAGDIAENVRIMKRAERKRASKADKRSAELARSQNGRLHHQHAMLWDVEF